MPEAVQGGVTHAARSFFLSSLHPRMEHSLTIARVFPRLLSRSMPEGSR